MDLLRKLNAEGVFSRYDSTVCDLLDRMRGSRFSVLFSGRREIDDDCLGCRDGTLVGLLRCAIEFPYCNESVPLDCILIVGTNVKSTRAVAGDCDDSR
jgi:hypothetical protein